MTTVKDTQGRPWHVHMSAATTARIRETVARNGKPFAFGNLESFTADVLALQTDFITLARLVFAIVSPQAAERGVSEADFLDALHGDVLDDMLAAVVDEAVAFFPPAVRQIASQAREMIEASSANAIDTAITEIEAAFLQPAA